MKKLLILLLTLILLVSAVGCQKAGNESEPETEPETTAPTESAPVTEGPTENQTKPDEDRIAGKYFCSTNAYSDEFRPFITFNDDGRCTLLVNFFRGDAVIVEGSYQIKENTIDVELDLEGTPVGYTYEDGRPCMDDRYIFKIIDNDHIVIGAAPNSYYDGYFTVRLGDSFIRR